MLSYCSTSKKQCISGVTQLASIIVYWAKCDPNDRIQWCKDDSSFTILHLFKVSKHINVMLTRCSALAQLDSS